MSYEPRDASVRVIVISSAIMGGLLVGSVVFSTWMYHTRYHGESAMPTSGRQTSFTGGANAKLGIVEDMTRVTQAADQRLEHYGWVDRQAGIARIPIERAMQLVGTGAKPAPMPKEPGQVP